MRVINEPVITFTCKHCGTGNAGEPHEFHAQHTMPPTWKATCGFCKLENTVSPSALLAREASNFFR